jgi:hypothetical protein
VESAPGYRTGWLVASQFTHFVDPHLFKNRNTLLTMSANEYGGLFVMSGCDRALPVGQHPTVEG